VNGRLPPPTIGARVWAMYQGARRSGKVLSVNDKRSIFKIRFDDFPTAEFDYSFSYKSPDWSYINPPSSSSSSSITTTETTNNDNEPLFSISRKFKALIKVKNIVVFCFVQLYFYLNENFCFLVYVTT
jgi:hypothetical protein